MGRKCIMKIFKHKHGAFSFDAVKSVDLIPSLSTDNNAYLVTLKNGKQYELLKCDNGLTMEEFIELWESELYLFYKSFYLKET